MPKTAAPTSIPLAPARAAFFAAQGIPPAGKPALLSALERTGFVRTLGGIDVYLALRARVPGLSRADLDRAVDRHEAQVLPSVRGCIYLVPRRDAAVALRAADLLSRGRAEREHQKAGIRPGEVGKVAREVLAALKKAGPSTTDALRRALPEGVVRSLGEAGKKVGISSPLPPVLRLLEFEGKVERTLDGGRLDTERYLWRAAEKSPFEGARVPEDPVDLWARLGEVFFRAAGLGTLKSFAEWAGISLRDATAAAGKLPLAPVAIEGVEETHLVLEAERRSLLEAKGTNGAVSFLPFEDNLLALRGGPAILVDPAFHGLRVPVWGGKDDRLGAVRFMSYRSIVAEGRVVGFWEFDPKPGRVVVACFDKVKPPVRKRIDAEAAEVGAFITRELGHGKSFSIDSDAELSKRAAALAKLAR